MDIYLRKQVTENKEISDEGIAVYCALRKFYTTSEKEYYISINMLAYALSGKTECDKVSGKVEHSRSFIDAINRGLNDLVSLELITIKSNVGKREYILDLSNLYFTTDKVTETKDYFSIIRLDEIQSIMNISEKVDNSEKVDKCKRVDKCKLLRYYIALIGSFNQSADMGDYKGKVSGVSIEYLSEISNVSDRSIFDYNKLLVDAKILYIYHFGDFLYSDGEVKTISNGYGRYEDRFLVDAFCNMKKGMKGYKTTKGNKVKRANNTKSVVMKYNALCNGKVYEKETIIEIYEGIVEFNNRMDSQGEYYEDRKKDMSVFDNYDYLNIDKDTSLSIDEYNELFA